LENRQDKPDKRPPERATEICHKRFAFQSFEPRTSTNSSPAQGGLTLRGR
jgi:hypothetical protein